MKEAVKFISLEDLYFVLVEEESEVWMGHVPKCPSLSQIEGDEPFEEGG